MLGDCKQAQKEKNRLKRAAAKAAPKPPVGELGPEATKDQGQLSRRLSRMSHVILCAGSINHCMQACIRQALGFFWSQRVFCFASPIIRGNINRSGTNASQTGREKMKELRRL